MRIQSTLFGTILLTLALALAGCAPLVTQSPGGKLSPVNAVAMDGNDRVILKGADVVAYFTQNAYKQGNPAIKSTYENVTFYFSSAENKALFDKEPTRYLPEFGGYCANGIVYAIPWGGDADTWRMLDGKLYIFGGAGIHVFAFSMLVGTITGCYSTVYIANPVLLWLVTRPSQNPGPATTVRPVPA